MRRGAKRALLALALQRGGSLLCRLASRASSSLFVSICCVKRGHAAAAAASALFMPQPACFTSPSHTSLRSPCKVLATLLVCAATGT
eukprot:6201617-Pleurochrysis_carterae.AAC.3